MSTETQVRANSNLNFRAAGSKGAKVLCVVMKGVLIEQTSARNTNGFAKGIVKGYRKDGEMFAVADSFDALQPGAFKKINLGVSAVFIADKPEDEFGRVFGHVEGWFYAPFTTAVTPQEFVP